MAKRDRSAEALDAVRQLRDEPDATRLLDQLILHLSSRAGAIVAAAANVVLERQRDLEPAMDQLTTPLSAAFDRLMIDPVKSDPTCAGKIAIVHAGVAYDCLEGELYLRAIRHVQPEGSYGPPVDTAEALRGSAAFGLLNQRHRGALYEIIELLGEVDAKYPDRLPDSRRGGIRALGTVVSEASAGLLRMTANRFTDDADTLAEVFTSLNQIEPEKSAEFIARFLDHIDPRVSDTAALALAEGRTTDGCERLLAHAKSSSRVRRRGDDPLALYTALALTRREPALAFLMERVSEGLESDAAVAIEALQPLRHDPAVAEQVKQRVATRKSGHLDNALARW